MYHRYHTHTPPPLVLQEHGVSNYENAREIRKQRNDLVMKSLGLDNTDLTIQAMGAQVQQPNDDAKESDSSFRPPTGESDESDDPPHTGTCVLNECTCVLKCVYLCFASYLYLRFKYMYLCFTHYVYVCFTYYVYLRFK